MKFPRFHQNLVQDIAPLTRQDEICCNPCSFTDINECSSNPCKNNGTCIDLVGEFKCYCMPGFNGSACETGRFICFLMNISRLR